MLPKYKYIFMITNLWEKIKEQEKNSKVQHKPACERCECCGKTSGGFRKHERRPRKIRLIVGNTVVYALVWLIRWKCLACNKTFTEYPDFVARHKRYAVQGIQELAHKYVTTMDLSYARVVLEREMAISHVGDGDEFIDQRLAGSTVWRWLRDWGNLQKILYRAINMITQKSPENMVIRDIYPVQGKKYRSEKRRSALECFLRMFPVSVQYFKIFGKKIFPGFATPETRS